MRSKIQGARRVVVKIGTSSLLDAHGLLDLPVVERHLRDLVSIHRAGVRPVLVSSGAIGVGRGLRQFGFRIGFFPASRRIRSANASSPLIALA